MQVDFATGQEVSAKSFGHQQLRVQCQLHRRWLRRLARNRKSRFDGWTEYPELLNLSIYKQDDYGV